MMANAEMNNKSCVYQAVVTASGLALWLIAVADFCMGNTLQDQLQLLTLVPLVITAGLFLHHFRLPSGLNFTRNTLVFTPVDALVLLVACWQGPGLAIIVAALEGFTSSRRTVRRLSSNLFSFSMMAITAAAASASLHAVLRYGFNEPGSGRNHTLLAVALAMLIASLVQLAVNFGLLSTLFALRQHTPVANHWKDFLWATPMFLPTSTAASLMYVALNYDVMIMFVIGGPILLAIYFSHRQYRDSLQKRIAVMEKAHRETIEALAVAINAKDEVTHEHVLRVQIYAAGVARLMGCSEAEIEALRAGALLHDIGKIAVPDYILNKPGKLTAAEFEKMKLHTVAGAQILSRVEFPYPVVPVVRHHHERWDGKGYPDSLSGEDIPLTARILSVVDCFDAVREDRQYRKGMSREEAVALIMQGSGTQYDPQVIGTFVTHLPQFEAEIQALRDVAVPTFGIEPAEQLSEAARQVVPAAGLDESEEATEPKQDDAVRDEVRALFDLAQALMSARTQGEILRAFTGKLNAVVGYDTCAVTLATAETGDNVVAHASGPHAALVEGRKFSLGEGVTGWVIANRKPFCNTDPKLDLPPQLADHFAAYKTLAIFPIINGPTLHGAVTLYSSSLAEYLPEHQGLAEQAVALLATALSNAAEVRESRRRPAAGPARVVRVAHSTPLTRAELNLDTDLFNIESDLAH